MQEKELKMAKKVVKAKHALKNKGKKAPRPEKAMKPNASMAPAHRPSMKHDEPAGPYSVPKGGEQSVAPEHKKKALPMKDAPKGVAGPNGGDSMELPKGENDRH